MVEGSDLASCHSSNACVRTGIELDAEDNKFAGARLPGGLNEPATTVEPFVITYAANRYMGHQNADELSDPEPVDLLRTDRTELVDAADVLSQLDYSALKGNAKSKARLDGMKGALAEILPFIDAAGDIDIQDPEAPGGGDPISNPERERPAGRTEPWPPYRHRVDRRLGVEAGQAVSGQPEAAR